MQILGEIIDSTDNLSAAVHKFSKQRAPESEALVRISRELDRPGKLGFITFILPLILDSVFHKLAPKVFETNTIAMLQREGYSFCRVQRRKRLDRIGQAAIIGTFVTGIGTAARYLVKSIAKLLGRQASTVVAGTAAAVMGFTLLRKLGGYLIPGMAPADILNKANKGSKLS
jgi:hypothetical protein